MSLMLKCDMALHAGGLYICPFAVSEGVEHIILDESRQDLRRQLPTCISQLTTRLSAKRRTSTSKTYCKWVFFRHYST